MKKYLFLLLPLFLLVIPSFTIAQETVESEDPQQIAAKYGITFPISELGNCADYSACRTYCEDPINQATCIDFAKKKGFYKEEGIEGNTELIEKAQIELGCNSMNSCKAICEQPSNYEKCHAFATNHGVSGGYKQDPNKSEIIEKAKTVLGCDSAESCKSICEDESNRQKCSDFAKEVGLRGGEHKKGPGGCNSESSCRTYCESNPQECRYGGGGTPDEAKRKAEEYAGFCRENPQRCGTGESGSFENSQKRDEFEKYCIENPDKCRYNDSGNYDPKTECTKYPGCSWTNNSCQCSVMSPVNTYSGETSNTQPTQGSYPDPATECTKHSGCSWTNNSCQCSSSGGSSNTPTGNTSSDPAAMCGQTTGCSWNGSTCQCSGVQGVTVEETFLQKILNLFFPL